MAIPQIILPGLSFEATITSGQMTLGTRARRNLRRVRALENPGWCNRILCHTQATLSRIEPNWVIINVMLFCAYIWKISQLFSPTRNWSRKWLRAKPEAAMERLLRLLADDDSLGLPRGQVDDDVRQGEMTWSFGQIMPLLMLMLPAFLLFEFGKAASATRQERSLTNNLKRKTKRRLQMERTLKIRFR